jgi:hypothetical protein
VSRLYAPNLGCSYRASSARIAIRLPTDATVYFLYLFPLFLPYMFRVLINPSSGVPQAVFYIQPLGSCGVYVAHLRVPVDWFVVVVSLYWCRGGSPLLVALRVPVDWFVVVVLLIPFLLSLATTRFIHRVIKQFPD